MKVHWTDTAEGHLDAIYAYIAQDSPEYARRIRWIGLPGDLNKLPNSLSQVVESLNMMLTQFEK